jgi:hypothetical protein
VTSSQISAICTICCYRQCVGNFSLLQADPS